MLLYLIRHGESIYNSEGRIQGQADIELSDFGHRQAQAIAQGLSSVSLDAVFSSPLKRAYQTAQPLARLQGLELQTHDGLKEINAGAFSGLLWSEVATAYPQYVEQWNEQHMDFVIPGGESRQMLQARGMAAFNQIANLPLERVAVVAHGGLLCTTLKGLLQIPASLNPFSLFNASISRLVWDGQWKLLTLNQTEHLLSANLANEAGRGNL
jgi:2,3-bisphosphoglycerate-dependent phosphoglycerate mutase